MTNAGGCTLVTKGFFLHVTIESSSTSSSRTDSSSSGSTAKQEKHFTAFFKVERHIIDGSLTAAKRQLLSLSTDI